MEGFLLKKGREGSYVTYYENFSLDKNEPVNKKGTAPVRGCKIEAEPKSEKKFGFVMTHETRKPLHMAAETEKIMKMWMKALEKAATGAVGPITINFDEFYDVLGMERDTPYTFSELNKFYRKAALKNHPDKGGDQDAFKKVQEAFEVLKSRLDEEEEEKLWTTMDYSAKIQKGGDGVGFGMVVSEDAKKAQMFAKRVMEKIIIVDIDSSSGGEIQSGDQIIKIDNDDITSWPLLRVVQRLNEYRAPVGTVVRFTFRRRVRIGAEGEQQHQQFPQKKPESDFAEDERIFQEQQERQKREEEETKRRMGFGGDDGDSASGKYGDMNDIDEDDCDVDSQFGDDINDIDEGSFGDTTEEPEYKGAEKFSRPTRSATTEAEDIKDIEKEKERQKEKKKQRLSWSKKEPIDHIVCLYAEIDELERERRELRSELKVSNRDLESYKSNYHDMMLDLEDVREEAHMFLEQLEAAELECQAASRRELAAMDVINQISGAHGGGISSEMTQQVLKDVREAADMVQKGYDLTGEYGYSLEDSEHLSSQKSIEYAQKNAYSAAIMVDKSGIFAQKYDQDALSADLISRLENTLQNISSNPTAEDDGMGWFNDDLNEYPGRRSFEIDQNKESITTAHRSVSGKQRKPLKINQPPQPRRPPPRLPHQNDPHDHYFTEEKLSSNVDSYNTSSFGQPLSNDNYKQDYPPYQYADHSASQQRFSDYSKPSFDGNHGNYHSSPQQSPYQDPYSYGNSHDYGGMRDYNQINISPDSSTKSTSSAPLKFGPRKKVKKSTKKAGFR